MIRTLKQKMKDYLSKKYDALYFQEWDEKTCSYEDWLKKQQPQENTLYKTEKFQQLKNNVSVIPWSKLEEISKFSEYDLKDIMVFVQGKEGLLEDAIDKITAVFLENPEVKVVYGDEDEINSNETIRMNPWFKPDYSPDTLLSYFYFGSVVAFRKDALENIIMEEKGTAREKLYALTLQVCIPLSRNAVYHCREMLYTSHAVSYWGWEESYQKIKAKYQNIRPKVKEEGVSIIIPSKDNPKVLKQCLESIVKWTKDVDYEIIVVDNGSNEENKKIIEGMKIKIGFNYIYNPMEFNFSIMCNTGAGNSKKNILLFLNDDCEVRQSKWLRRLTNQAVICNTGAVGAKLCYPNSKTIQHCGIYALHVGPVHKLQFREDTRSYYDRRNLDIRNVLAVTGACLMVRKEVFEEVGGFDAGLRVAFNDVDLCYKIYEAGYNNVIDNEVHLWHHESLSRGSEDSPEKIKRHIGEKIGLYQRHKDLWNQDPYYHPGFTSHFLDINYSYDYEYDADRNKIAFVKPIELEKLPQKIREDQCLVPMIEFAGNIREWFMKEEDAEEIIQQAGSDRIVYFQGNMVVLGSNNACYEKNIILRHEESGKFYRIDSDKKYRPDIFTNLPDQKNVALSGFSFFLNLEDMPQGSYEIGAMAKDQISGQYLLRITSLKVENNP